MTFGLPVETCKGSAWNVVEAAGALSQLAGLIAAFVFAGIIMLLSEPRPYAGDSKQRTALPRLRTINPFIATFVAMSLNAYVFGLLSGENARSCRRVWSATTIASGMLAIGTVAAVCGIMLLVLAYFARHHVADSDKQQLRRVERLLKITIILLGIVAPALLVQRAYEFLNVWYAGNLLGLGWMVFIVIAALLPGVVLVMVSPTPLKRLWYGPANNKMDHFDRVMSISAIITVFYSVIGTAAVGSFLGVLPDWNAVPPVIPWGIAITAVVVPMLAIVGHLCAILGIVRHLEAQSPELVKVQSDDGEMAWVRVARGQW